MFGNIFAFLAGLGAAGLAAYLFPGLRRGVDGVRENPADGRDTGEQPRRASIEAGVLDLNDADEDELQELPGIGPALAGRIIENRPYRNKLDLISRMVIPEGVYGRIKDLIDVSDERAEEPIQVAL